MTPADSSTTLTTPVPVPVIRIHPTRGWIALKLDDLWEYRELLYFLTWRDIKVRYKQTALGASWAIIQPLMTMVVFTLFFGKLGKMEELTDVPYPVLTLAALVPWTFFTYGLTQASNSLVGSHNLIKKVYFPRLAIPIATVLSGVVDFLFAFLILLAMMFYYKVMPASNLIWLPLFVALAFVTSLGIGLWLTAMNVHYRDVRYVVPFLTQFWMFATPIAYPIEIVPEQWRTIYGLNPMVGVIEGFRWALLAPNAGTPPGPMLAVSAVVASALLVSGAFYFRRMEKSFADVI
jgi:lipopolysaccharide transport system permease protein